MIGIQEQKGSVHSRVVPCSGAVRSRGWAALPMTVLLAMFATGCASTPASPEQKRLAERQLLLPFLQNTEVACGELEVEITPNFHLHVSNPGVDKRIQRFDRHDKEALVEKVWSNLTGDNAGWFTVTIAEPKDPTDVSGAPTPGTTFTVMNQFTLRIRERGALTLSAHAKGGYVLVREAGGQPREVPQFVIANGVVSQ
jgi:hypothetical protein